MDLGEVDRITADAIGEPGMRTFYLQARSGAELVTVILEKEQVQLLATSVLDLLADLSLGTGEGPDDAAMALEWPDDPRWRAGRISLGYDGSADRFVLEVEESRPELEDPEDPAFLEGEAESVTLRATREQMLALSRYGAAVAERGRPACPLCGNPMDPEGHVCPATNGHRTPRS